MRGIYDRYRELTEARLGAFFTEERIPQRRLLEAMRYSLLAGGKRIRPVLAMAFCAASGGKAEDALDFGCAIEMLHTYSLIHDDLPCMDNDELRRGKPTSHVVFGEYTAVLAGDALQSAAFETLLSAPLDAERKASAALILAKASGAYGMCGGQQLDMEGEGRTLSVSEIELIHKLKTAEMIRAAALLGCTAAGADAEKLAAAENYAAALGLAFQIRDDILDVESTTAALGKPAGSDCENEKATFASLLGAEKCRELVIENTQTAKRALKPAFSDTDFLEWLADFLAGRLA